MQLDESKRKKWQLLISSLITMLRRIEALGTVHRRLYQSDDVGRFDVAEFAGDLVAASGRDDIKLQLDLDPVHVPASTAAPLALMLNEPVTNAIKHVLDGHFPITISWAPAAAGTRVEVVLPVKQTIRESR